MEGKMSLYYQKQRFFFSPRSPFFSVKMIPATSLFVIFFLQGQPRLTVDKWSQDGHIICPVIFWGEKTIRWMPCIMFFFFPLFPSLDFTLKSLIGLRKGLLSRWNSVSFMLESCRRSRTGPRPVQISPIWTYPVSASWHGAGIQYYRQAGHQMGVGFISVSLSSPPPPFPLPSRWRLIQVMSHFFLLDSSDRMPENSMSLRTEQLFSLILWLIFFFPVVVVVLLLFSDRLLHFLFPRSLFVFIPKSLGRGERLQLQQWRPLWQNTEYVFNYLDFLMLLSSHRKYCSCSDVPIMFSFECLLSAGSPTPLPTPHHFQQPSSVHHF